jgi:FAD/FMN-containing dehydrogenase
MTRAPRHPPSRAVLDKIASVVGPKGIVADADAAPFLSEWRGRWPGEAALIVTPASTEEVAAVVRICAENNVAITPQGGNTGLVGGQIPSGDEILLSLKRMRAVRDVSPLNNTMTVEAGLTLAEAQELAEDADRLFPLSIGAEGTCQIGGVISTNAGGVNVLRYGNTRDLILGLEAVTPDGRIWNGLKRLRKDNTGYDLKQLLIGGEGTLGIVTAAVLKLFPRPAETLSAFAGMKSAEDAVALLAHAQAATGGGAISFELMTRICVELTANHIPGVRDPFDAPHGVYVLMQFAAGEKGTLRGTVEDMLARAHEQGLIEDAVIPESEAQSDMLWKMRHSMSEAINHEGLGARHDVSVATSDIPAFLEKAGAEVSRIAPDARIVAFGHIGDGNVHYDVIGPEGAPKDALDNKRADIERAVYDVIDGFDGSISAEHGVGRHRRDSLAKRKSAVELDMMHAVKKALDPQGIMNPGKLL